jgi:DNA helicase-2/ATP-dependent DNA helicase PcrA
VDCLSEFWDAVRLSEYGDVDTGLGQLTNRRTHSRPTPPDKALSTIHKAKGLECEGVIVLPCDAKMFPDKPEARRLLYVALSRARCNLMLVVSRDNPTPLFLT